MEKDYKFPSINELEQGKISLSPHAGHLPAVAYKQNCIVIPKNLVGEVEYTLGIGTPNERMPLSTGIYNLQRCINNIHEMLSFIIIHQNHTVKIKPLVQEMLTEVQKLSKALEPTLEKQLKKIIENIEQNRINIKADLEKIKLYSEEKHETLFTNQQRIIDQLNEQRECKIIELKRLEDLIKEKSEKEELQKLNKVVEDMQKENIKLKELLDKNNTGSTEQIDKLSSLLSDIKKENNTSQKEIKGIIEKGVKEILDKI